MDGYHTHLTWDERYSGIEEGCVLSNPRSLEEEHACVSLPVVKARCAKKAAATERDCSPTSPASMRSRIPGNSAVSYGRFRRQIGRSRSQSVELLPSRPLLVHGIPAASRKTSGPAVHEARISVKPVRAVPAQGDMRPRQPLELAEVLATLAAVLDKPRNSRSLEEESEAGVGVASYEMECTEVLNGGGSGGRGLQRLAVTPKCSAFYAPVTSTLE